jgi:ankyrin repeat protein
MAEFETWLPDIRSKPHVWLAPIIGSGDAELALELIRDNPHLLESRFSGNATPLLLAAYSGQHRIADALLAMGAKMDFIAAIALGRTELVQAMLKDNPSLIRKHSPRGWTALHIAARYAPTETVALLISAGADVNSPGKQGFTPLFWATPDEPFSNAELLLAKGADIDARGKHGSTLLHGAAKWGYAGFVAFLLAHGARTDSRTDARQTAWELAVRQGHRSVSSLLRRW